MDKLQKKVESRMRRKKRIRKKMSGTTERPRLTVYRSNDHIYVQVVNDTERKTLLGASTLTPAIREEVSKLGKMDSAKRVGKLVAQLCKDKNIEMVVFDRNGYMYHGRVKALAEAAREAGLIF